MQASFTQHSLYCDAIRLVVQWERLFSAHRSTPELGTRSLQEHGTWTATTVLR